ncbi:energy transducer TonB [Hymenobacter sp. BT664]|uniref:Energy transducer TonB n=1 Tax=Hymenobacter montanus TaxID=2771359 RepID=A0A927BAA6_9BACT|nr:energy transducer TonB [Hymenobacter montanus]MBD2767001.1 energy transducer TonB [Hymenobacter montanus]
MMTNAQLATASLNDMVFDGRNRQYGAYELRVLYRRHVTRALGIAITMCAPLVVFPLAMKLRSKALTAVPTVVIAKPNVMGMLPITLEEVVLPPPATKPLVVPPESFTGKALVPIVAADKVVVENKKAPGKNGVLNQAKPEGKAISNKNSEGDLYSGPNLKVGLEPKGIECSAPIVDVPPPPLPFLITEVLNVDPVYEGCVLPPEERELTIGCDLFDDPPVCMFPVEQMPELPSGGGQMAIVTAIQRALKYPRRPLYNRLEGKIFARFTVDPKGDVTDVKIVKGLDPGLDEETVRAIKKLPRFIPAKQNGRQVSVSFIVPVTYQIQ